MEPGQLMVDKEKLESLYPMWVKHLNLDVLLKKIIQ